MNVDRILMVAAGVLLVVCVVASYNMGTGDRSSSGADRLPIAVQDDGTVPSRPPLDVRPDDTVRTSSGGADLTPVQPANAQRVRDLLDGATWPDYPPLRFDPYQRAGRATGQNLIAGKVINIYGEPIEGARVMLLPGEPGSGRVRIPPPPDSAGERCAVAVVSGPTGDFRVPLLPDGPHRLWTACAFHSETEVGVPTGTDSLAVRLDEFGRIVGTVTGGDGKAVPTFTVLIAYAGPLLRPGETDGAAVPTVPARYFEAGVPMWSDPLQANPGVFRYTFANVRNGKFACYTGIGRFRVWVFGDNTSISTQSVACPANTVLPLSFTLSRPTSIQGVAVAADDPDAPVARAVIQARYHPSGKVAGSTHTDADGSFRFDLPHAGQIRLIINHQQYLPYNELFDVADGEKKQVRCLVKAGCVLVGKVLGPDGKPLAGMNVRVAPRESAGTMLRTGNGTTDNAGEFRVPGLTEGRHVVSVDPTGPYMTTQKLVDIAGEKTEVTLQVEGGITCVFTVRRADGSELPTGLRVGVSRDPSSPPIERGDPLDKDFHWSPGQQFYNGEVILAGTTGTAKVQGVLPGKYIVQIRHAELKSFDQVIEVPGGSGEFAVQLTVDGGASLAGRVTDTEGKPLAGVQIQCMLASGDDATKTRIGRSDEQGNFRVAGIESGDYKVQALLRDYRPWEEQITFESAAVTREIRLDGGIVLTGTVRTPDGQPARQGWLQLEAPARGAYEQQPGTLIRDGAFRMAGLVQGRYRIRVNVPGYLAPPNLEVDLTGGGTVEIEIQMVGGGGLTGTVTGPDGKGVRQARVELRKVGENDQSHGNPGAYTQPDGRYEIRGIPPGEYRLSVRPFELAPYDATVTIGEDMATQDITLQAGLTISGVVRQAGGGIPQAYEQVTPESGIDSDGTSARVDP
ncbi:MAG: carboxypeptidase regulatory-like domain-containing protein, partial [Planctomycetota bacterium]